LSIAAVTCSSRVLEIEKKENLLFNMTIREYGSKLPFNGAYTSF